MVEKERWARALTGISLAAGIGTETRAWYDAKVLQNASRALKTSLVNLQKVRESNWKAVHWHHWQHHWQLLR